MSSPKKIEQIYQKKTPREHVLLRPDMYIGAITQDTTTMFLLNEDKSKMVEKVITYNPGLLKIFDEILVNAIDNKQRDPSMSYVSVNVDREKGKITVENDGKGIPVELHKKHNVFIPELIFGHMLTSSNFNDNVKRVVGGRNGYGAKLTNIFSKQFIVETSDGNTKFKQIHSKNMTKKTEPIIVKKKTKNYTKISFIPDFERFGVEGINDAYFNLIERRVYDIAGVSDKSVKVKFNGVKVPVTCFKDYLAMFVTEGMPIIHQKVNDRWEIGISISDGHFKQVSYVNSICTTSGGSHANYIAENIAKYVCSKKKDLKSRQIKDFMFLFVNCLIVNPAFKSQTKNELTTKVKDFGSKCELPEIFLKKVVRSQIVVEAIEMGKHKEARIRARKTDGKKTSKIFGITKLTDARHAGTKKSKDCTLILVEGDSAKTLALAGIPAIQGEFNQHYYGIYPLKGKVLNVREANNKQIANNPEITNIKKIIGLRENTDYSDSNNFNQLRYGKLMIMVDQDFDGSHIKGLLINFFHLFWPSLLKRKNFLYEFITPIVVCKQRNFLKEFYTIPQYENWKENHDTSKFDIKYYKGLGTSSNIEAERYFSDLNKHQIKFKYEGEDDDKAILLAFSKSKVDARKNWLADYVPGTFLDHDTDYISYDNFVNKELILFSMADNQRSIPSMIDGLKPGQRKILHTCLKLNIVKGAKVPQLAGYVMSHTAYHHGDAALQGTIIKMAQCFVGSNNLNLLQPIGQFGSRGKGGKDAANARYISTHLAMATRSVFHKDDDAILKYLNDDGIVIEPEWYMPVIPLVLVNGTEGIGTGWSTSVPCFNPFDIIKGLKSRLNNEGKTELHPWYRNWKGSLRLLPGKKDYAIVGKIELLDAHHIRITELPIKMWTETYKAHLAKLLEVGILSNIFEEHSVDAIDFTLETSAANPIREISDFLLKTLKLTGNISMTNMVLFDRYGKLKKYNSANEIIDDFYEARMEFYDKRKINIIKVMKSELKKVENKARFIMAIIKKELKITNRPKKEILLYLKENKYDAIFKNETTEKNDENGYDYLLSMSIWTLTLERFEKLKENEADLKRNLEEFEKKTLKELWLEDLENLENVLIQFYKKIDEENSKSIRRKKGSNRGIKNFAKKRKKPSSKQADQIDGKENKPIKQGFFSKMKGEFATSLFSKIITNEKWEDLDLKAKKKTPNFSKQKIQKTTKNNKKENSKNNQKSQKNSKSTENGKKSIESRQKSQNSTKKENKPKKSQKKKRLNFVKSDYEGETDETESLSESEFSSENGSEEYIPKKMKETKNDEKTGKLEKNLGKSREKTGKLAKKQQFFQKNIENFVKKDWNCRQCTYLNSFEAESCEICSAEKIIEIE